VGGEAATVGGARIVLVETESGAARDLQELLAAFGYDVIAAVGTGLEALGLVRSCAADVVLHSVRQRGPADAVRSADLLLRTHRVPTVFLASLADVPALERALASGRSACLVRPFLGEELHTTVEATLLRSGLEAMFSDSDQRQRQLDAALEAAREDERVRVSCEIAEGLGRRLEQVCETLVTIRSDPELPPDVLRSRLGAVSSMVDALTSALVRIGTAPEPLTGPTELPLLHREDRDCTLETSAMRAARTEETKT